jgi:arylformamidase
MRRLCLRFICTALTLFAQTPAGRAAQTVRNNIPYIENGHIRHVLDIHYAAKPGASRPVVFWIHGGGWQTGDKTHVKSKPEWFASKGFVFVAINHRLLPEVEMESLMRDVAKALGWVRKNISNFGGDPDRILVGGHSSGAQLAALLCCDQSYAEAEGVSLKNIIGCIPVDGDTYDIPAIIETAETRRRVHQQPQPKFGHREKFGNTPEKHAAFSTVNHVEPNKHIPPFLILYVGAHPDNSAQATRLASCLKDARVPVSLFAGKNTDHVKLNDLLGTPNDLATAAISSFLGQVLPISIP